MLILDSNQFEAFARESFLDRMQQLLTEIGGGSPDLETATALRKQIAEQLGHARKHGFLGERDCALWCLAAWCIGADFYQKIRPIAELLARPDIGANYKSLALEIMLRSFSVSLAGYSRGGL